MKTQPWYQLTIEETTEALGSDFNRGLTNREAAQKAREFGPNELRKKAGVPALAMFFSQFNDFMVLVLIAATAVSGLLGEYADAITIMAIVIVNAVLGFVQEFRAEKSIVALQQLTAPESRVLREGELRRIPARDLVPGDIILLETGDRVPADARILQLSSLEIEESMLTGESVPVKKVADLVIQGDAGLGDRRNMVHMGTIVTRGKAKAIVVATAMASEIGQIAGMIEEAEAEDTPLQRRLDRLGKWLVALCLGICAVVALTGVLRGENPYRMFLVGVSLAVAAIPEGLPAIVTVALALGVQKMVRRHAIVRKLTAVETLGCATIICSDKTGTLTKNEMTVKRLFTGEGSWEVTGTGYDPKGDFMLNGQKASTSGEQGIGMLLKTYALCNNAALKRDSTGISGMLRLKSKAQPAWGIVGDPTEGALLVAAAKAGIWRENVEKAETRLEENPFDSERKLMSVVCRLPGGGLRLYLKGAPDVVLGLSDFCYREGQAVPLGPEERSRIIETNNAMAGQAMRVLAAAYRDIPAGVKAKEAVELEKNLTFLGMAGMIDPPRPAAVHAIDICRQAGIKVAMITGDHPVTARAIATEMGLPAGADQVLTGIQLDTLLDQELNEKAGEIFVYARVSPKHKLRIVKALKTGGHVVAMTGDGVNDAPAIKEADIGISMGKTGTDVAKEASSMVLADDNFATIVTAIEDGRSIYDNIRKFVRYLLASNVGEVLTMFLASLMGLPLPLLPIQILWVNLVTDGLPAMALGVDNAEPDLMTRKPRSPGESVFSGGLLWLIGSRGLYIGVATLFVFALAVLGGVDLVAARTMAFTTLVFLQLLYVFECRSERHSVFQTGFFSNRYLVLAVAVSTIMHLATIYVPLLRQIFKTAPLNSYQWGLVLLVAFGPTIIGAIRYYLIRPVSRKLVYLKI